MRRIILGALGALLLLVALFFVQNLFNSNDHNSSVPEVSEKVKLTKERKVLERAQHEFNMTHDPALGYIPRERLWVAQRYAQKIRKEIAQSENPRGPLTLTWTNRGPDNVGGRTRALMFDPTDGTNKRVFAGGVSGGLWQNADITNPLSGWTKINDFLDNLAISAIAYDPNNTSTWYLGTGEAYTNVVLGNGVYKSTDAGATWSHLTNTSDHSFITSMVVRNESGTSVIYMGGKEKYIGGQTAGGATVFKGKSGLWRSADGGLNWTQVLPQNANSQDQTADHVELDTANNLWVSTGRNAFGHKGGDIFTCSTGCDMPANWTLKFDASANGYSDVDRTTFALSPSDINRIYAMAGKDGAGQTDMVYIIKSTDGGTNWTAQTIPKKWDLQTCTVHATDHFTNGQATYDLCLEVHPTNPDNVLFGGIDLFRTTNGFTSTSHIGSWYQSIAPCDKEIHADQHTIIYRPGSPNEVIFGNDGGVYYSADAGNAGVALPTFAHHVKDYNTTQFYACDIHPTAGTNIYIAGSQDNGTQYFNNSTTTSEAVGGDGAVCHIDQNQPNIQIGAYIYNDFTETNDSWVTRSQINPTPQTGRFINPADYDYTNNILYSGSDNDQICRTTGVGSGAAVLTDGINVTGAGTGSRIATAIKVSPNTPTTIYIGNDQGNVYQVLNANTGASINSTDISGGLPMGWIASIDVEKGNEHHMLVTLSNYGVNSVWETFDGGTTWVSVEGNLPDMPIRWGILSPINNDQALVATDLGVWTTDNLDGGTTVWGSTNSGLANVRCDMIKYRHDDGTLRSAATSATVAVATHGRGLYTAQLMGPLAVEFIDIKTTPKESSILLEWTTATEINNKGFEIQRSSDNSDFRRIGWKEGNGSASHENSYVFEDKHVEPGVVYYYRLKQVDFDGGFNFSSIVEAIIVEKKGKKLAVFPNPANDHITLEVPPSEFQYEIDLIGLNGKKIGNYIMDKNSTRHEIDLTAIPQGNYVLRIQAGNQLDVEPLLVVK